MTPGARVAAAIDILEKIRAGTPAEQALTTWARASRFAGSKDRAAVRDHVFDVLRARRSLGDGAGRALMARLLLRDGHDVDAFFDGVGHAPPPLTATERAELARPLALSAAAACDVPDWLWPLWQDSLGEDAAAAARAQQSRADVFLRVNRRRASVHDARVTLADEGIATEPHATIAGCLRVKENARRIQASAAYRDGLVELQDASSQFAIATTPVAAGARLLDFCAGGGGKALGFADRYDVQVFAHDASAQRMKDIPVRATRAGVRIERVATDQLAAAGSFDVVFCDAPCSGSGTWRRSPDAKWRLTLARLAELADIQFRVICDAAALTGPDGILAYATCSVLRSENDAIIDRLRGAHPEWNIVARRLILPGRNGDGFFLCCLKRD